MVACIQKNPPFAESSLYQPAWLNFFSSFAYVLVGIVVLWRKPHCRLFGSTLVFLGCFSAMFHLALCTWMGTQDVFWMKTLLFQMGLARDRTIVNVGQHTIYAFTILDSLSLNMLEAWEHAVLLLVIPAYIHWRPQRLVLYVVLLGAGIGWCLSELMYMHWPWIAYFELLAVWHVVSAVAVGKILL